ncbi:dTDP-6-deoxy-3,4-keto-hexulose isomerase [Ralstonia pickettii]|jgi:dTDP-4-dehydrorhamnose 3,5-epimerase-like enzyme|nr:dTDP-6-deoxy-3,4-keto-hexulose isomerase [Ralstonia pickettii]
MEIELVALQERSDDRGSLVVLEEGVNFPFPIRRIYYVFGADETVRRGFHAHKKLNQLAIVIQGSCRFHLDDGREKMDLTLDNPARGLMLPPMLWHEMYDFSPDCVLMVVADDLYDESDYIRDYNSFIEVSEK